MATPPRARESVVLLAEVLSVAGHVEPALLRRARLEIFPNQSPRLEAELWFSDYVIAHARGGLLLDPLAMPDLRLGLLQRPWAERAFDLVSRVHSAAPVTVRFEERLIRESLTHIDGRAVIEVLWSGLLDAAMRDQALGRQLVRWLRGAWDRLPVAAKDGSTATLLRRVTEVGIEGRFLSPSASDSEAADLAMRLLGALPVGVQLTDVGLVVSLPPRPHAHRLLVPRTTPVSVLVGRADEGERSRVVVSGQPEHAVRLWQSEEGRGRVAIVQTMLGQEYRLRPLLPGEKPDAPRKVSVVTDSTAYLPTAVTREYGIEVVPLYAVLSGRSGREGIDVGPTDVARALAQRGASVSTSRPTPGDFVNVYRRCLAFGAEHVISIHLSSELSSTFDAARLAASQVGEDYVTVIDSRSAAMGLGFAVLAAARAAADGADPDAVGAAARDTADASTLLFAVDTLEHLRRGGRIGTAAAVLGSALAVKPILHMSEGRVVPLEKVRTSGRAMARLIERAVGAAGDRPVSIAVHHLAASERAEQLAVELRARLPSLDELIISELGAAIGAHVGLGAVGIVVAPVSHTQPPSRRARPLHESSGGADSALDEGA